MKLIAIRLIENKEPVMIIGGHRNQWDDKELFWRIDECVDPNECEYIDFNIPSEIFGIVWQGKLEKYDDCNEFNIQAGGISLCSEYHIALDDVFESKEKWNPVDIPLELIYPGINE